MANSLKQAFEKAARENYWGDENSLSGPGSNLVQTRVIRERIPELLVRYDIKKMLDAPCGDLFWMKEVIPRLLESNIQYNGADIVPELIGKHKVAFKDFNLKFYNIDITTDVVPEMDLIFTRDCFIHLSYSNILSVLKNYQRSGSKYLLVSTYTNSSRKNQDVDGFFLWGRMLNLEKFPFHFPKPIELIVEGCTEGNNDEYSDKSLGLWKISDLDLSRMERLIKISLRLRPISIALKKTRSLLRKVLGRVIRS